MTLGKLLDFAVSDSSSHKIVAKYYSNYKLMYLKSSNQCLAHSKYSVMLTTTTLYLVATLCQMLHWVFYAQSHSVLKAAL